MLMIERCDPSDAEHHAVHWYRNVGSAIGILVPGLHDGGQWVGTDGHWIGNKWLICAELSIVTLKKYEELLCYTCKFRLFFCFIH